MLCELVRESAAWVSEEGAKGVVRIREDKLRELAEELQERFGDLLASGDGGSRQGEEPGSAGKKPVVGWDSEGAHYLNREQPETMLRYLLVLDAINFCFWPSEDMGTPFEYDFLASSLGKVAAELTPENLSALDPGVFRSWFGGMELPAEEDRVQLLREVGTVLLESFQGAVGNLVSKAEGSAARLVDLMVESFPGFADVHEFEGRKLYFLKRAQIFVADVWGAFGGEGPGEFRDIHQLTMFADYRVPQLLREWGILEYNEELDAKIHKQEVIPEGSREEVAIRAATIQAVEQLTRSGHFAQRHLIPVEVDWMLWTRGEELAKAHTIQPHHRTVTTFY